MGDERQVERLLSEDDHGQEQEDSPGYIQLSILGLPRVSIHGPFGFL